jgi:hypothetical protein
MFKAKKICRLLLSIDIRAQGQSNQCHWRTSTMAERPRFALAACHSWLEKVTIRRFSEELGGSRDKLNAGFAG